VTLWLWGKSLPGQHRYQTDRRCPPRPSLRVSPIARRSLLGPALEDHEQEVQTRDQPGACEQAGYSCHQLAPAKQQAYQPTPNHHQEHDSGDQEPQLVALAQTTVVRWRTIHRPSRPKLRRPVADISALVDRAARPPSARTTAAGEKAHL